MIWRRIPFAKHYQASESGKVRLRNTHKLCRLYLNPNGYLYVSLRIKKGIWKTQRVNRVIALTFHDNPHNLAEVDHIDGDKLNNWATNLRWVSRKRNRALAMKSGRYKLCGRKPYASQTRIKFILELYYKKHTSVFIARELGDIHPRSVRRIIEKYKSV